MVKKSTRWELRETDEGPSFRQVSKVFILHLIQDPWNRGNITEVQHQSRKIGGCPHCGKTFIRPGNLAKHMDKQICMKKGFVQHAFEDLEMIPSSYIGIEPQHSPRGSDTASEEIIVASIPASEIATEAEVPMMARAEEGLHCFWEVDTGLEVLLVQVIFLLTIE